MSVIVLHYTRIIKSVNTFVEKIGKAVGIHDQN